MNDILLIIITMLYGIGIGFVIGMYVAKKIALKVVKEVLEKHKL